MNPGLAKGHEVTTSPPTLTKWQMYNFIEVRQTTTSKGKYNDKTSSRTVAGQCGVCRVVFAGHSSRHMRSHRIECQKKNRTPLSDVCVNQPQEPATQAMGSPKSHVVSATHSMFPQIGSSPLREPGRLLNSSLEPIPPHQISAQPSSSLHQPCPQPISASPIQIQSSPRPQPYSRPPINGNLGHRRSRVKTASNVDDRNVKLLKFALRHQIDLEELDCDISRDLFESLDPQYVVPQANELRTTILEKAIVELKTLQSTLEYRPYIVVTSQGAGNNKQVYSFAVSKNGNYVYIDSRDMPRGADASATLETFCDNSVELARQKLKIENVRFLMHGGVGRLKNTDRDVNPTYMRFPSFRDLIISFLTFDTETMKAVGQIKLAEYSALILPLLEKTKQASYTLGNALQDILDLREPLSQKDLLINPNLVSYFSELPNMVHVMANYLDIRFMNNSHFGNPADWRDKLITFVCDYAPEKAYPGFGHFLMGDKSQFRSLLERNAGNPNKFWQEVAIFNADMSKFALHMLSIPAAPKKLPQNKVTPILQNIQLEHNHDTRNLYCSIMLN
ncbi:hypothetical protein QAD02_010741 [Eretmocerus hayati]|uniref:Uncharacterized protein n=2 Tax=Eretmocerus hayati TaxID=131215 RepID=A0ACC2NV30_9HYME|nr:hypothetical protein QAD02_010740 [Eretmocerus hayati]KAJ8674955.1 hypothetical protein QAD02_010741 [Eretmocerus hayati]